MFPRDATAMNLLCKIVVILVAACRCDSDVGTTIVPTEAPNGTTPVPTNNVTEADGTTTTEIPVDFRIGFRGLYGGSYYNDASFNPRNVHYIHGTYQSPVRDYYTRSRYYRDKGSDETFDYYLGFAVSRMTDENFEYDDFQYYFHNINRTMGENETLPSDFIIACHPNGTFCPENTETVCLRNGTIFCMSQMDVVVRCSFNESLRCVKSVIPCVRACLDNNNNFEDIFLPCLGTIVIFDVYEDNKGKTLSAVGGTFVIVDALTEKERTFCVTVIVDPKKKLT